ncbi:hypothetical protein NSS79_25995 [Paenibacillus sp. FSL L8-0436]|uniref:hypothetical protein n=1 Tax=Paenibacillus sp. FSL L8-0436 TaxID=2954686 RepID=UPI003159393C
MELGLFEQMLLCRVLTEADYKEVQYAHSNDRCHVFHTDIGLVAVDRETGKFDSKDYKQMFQ